MTAPSTSAGCSAGDDVGAGEPLQKPVRRRRPQTGPSSPRRPHHRRGAGSRRGTPHRGHGRPQRGPRRSWASRPPTWPPSSTPTDPWSRSMPSQPLIRGRGPVPSRAVGSATGSTTSWSPTTWPGWWSAAASNDAGCGGHRPTSTRRPTGHLPGDHQRTSGSLRPRRHLRRHQHLILRGRSASSPNEALCPRARSTPRNGRTQGMSGHRRLSEGP